MEHPPVLKERFSFIVFNLFVSREFRTIQTATNNACSIDGRRRPRLSRTGVRRGRRKGEEDDETLE